MSSRSKTVSSRVVTVYDDDYPDTRDKKPITIAALRQELLDKYGDKIDRLSFVAEIQQRIFGGWDVHVRGTLK
jgi:hypothetical protein